LQKIFIFLSFFLSVLHAEQNLKTVNVLLGYDKPPFIFGQTTLTGIEADLIKEAFSLVGYKVVVSQGTRAEQAIILNHENEIDAIATLSEINPNLFYSDTLTTYENYIITRKKDNITIDSLEDLKNIKFITWKNAFNDLGEKFNKLYNPQDGKYKDSYHDTLTQLDDAKLFFSQQVDAIIVDKTVFKWHKIYFKNQEEYTFHEVFNTYKKYPVAFRSKKVRDDFNIGLNILKKNGRYDEIIDFYGTQDINQLITLTELLSDISSKYLFEQKKEELIHVLKTMVTHPDIEAISIKSKNEPYVYINLLKDNTLKNQPSLDTKSQEIVSKIYYKTDSSLLYLGELSLYYKQEYKTKNGNPIPSLESLITLSSKDYNHIKKSYQKLDLENDVTLALTEEERAYLLKHPTISVYNEKEWAPYNYNKNNTAQGFSIDYINLLASKLNIKIKYIQGYSWSEILNEMKDEKIDVITNIEKNKSRENYIHFTTPYIESKKVVFSNISNIKSISDLDGKIVALAEQSDIQNYLEENYPKIKIKIYKNIKDTIHAVINKEADAIIENYAVVNSFMKDSGVNIPFSTLGHDSKLTANLRIGVSKNKIILRDILEKAKSNVSEQEFSLLEEKWFGAKKDDVNIFTQQELEYIKNKKTIKVCASTDVSPYIIFDKQKTSGISIEFLNHITNKSKLNFEIIPSKSIGDSFKMTKEGICDVAPVMVTKPNLHDYLTPTNPMLSDTIILVTKINEPYINDLHELKDKKIAIFKGAKNLIEYAKSIYPDMDIIELDGESLAKVADGEYYGYISPSYNVSYKIANEYFNVLKVMSKIGDTKIDKSFGVTNREPLLLSIFNKSIDDISQLERQNIENAWLSIKVDKQFDYTRFIQLMSVALVIIFILLFFYFKQKILHKRIQLLNDTLEKRVKQEVAKNIKHQIIMMHQSKLAQMGEMIQNIAHQWRQPLAQINSCVLLIDGILVKNKMDSDLIEDRLLEIESLTEYMSKTIEDFQNFCHPNKQKTTFTVLDAIAKSHSIVKGLIHTHHIKIDIDIEDTLSCHGYLDELQQAILALVHNAVDALVTNAIESPTISIKAYKKDSSIIIKVQDNARGIADEFLEKIFDPYFTTKNKSQGTGLGLYMAKTIIESGLEGTIRVVNKPDGACFSIEIPQGNV
jgi:ABC-type amino acid transport substrate-binding protein/nitrogen-specific signal transduction histidine kinase